MLVFLLDQNKEGAIEPLYELWPGKATFYPAEAVDSNFS
jgi:hypothetical protein